MRLMIAAAFGAAFLLARMATAAPLCAERGALLARLATTYAEAPVAIGVASDGRLMEVLASADGATWTLIATTPAGLSCALLAGEGLRMKPRVEGDPKA